MWFLTASAYGATFGLGLGFGVQPVPNAPPTANVDRAIHEQKVGDDVLGDGLEYEETGYKGVSLRAPIDFDVGPRAAIRLTPSFDFAFGGENFLTGDGATLACAQFAQLRSGAPPAAVTPEELTEKQVKDGCTVSSNALRASLGAVVAPQIRFPVGGPAWGYLAPGAGLQIAQVFQDSDYGPWNGCAPETADCSGSPDKRAGVGIAPSLDLAAGLMLRPDAGPGTWFELGYSRSFDPGGTYQGWDKQNVDVNPSRFDVVRLAVGVLFGG